VAERKINIAFMPSDQNYLSPPASGEAVLGPFFGGDGGDRTPGLYVANVPLSHLSYIPIHQINSLTFLITIYNIPFLNFFQEKGETFGQPSLSLETGEAVPGPPPA
jgi:hypothetical protein